MLNNKIANLRIQFENFVGIFKLRKCNCLWKVRELIKEGKSSLNLGRNK